MLNIRPTLEIKKSGSSNLNIQPKLKIKESGSKQVAYPDNYASLLLHSRASFFLICAAA